MSHVYDNWEKLVTAVLKREQYWQLCHSDSLSSSSSSVSSDFSSSSSRRLSFDIPPDHLIELTPEDGHFQLHAPISYPSSQLDSGPKPPKTPTGWRIGRIAGAARQFFTPATMRRQSQMRKVPQDIIETGLHRGSQVSAPMKLDVQNAIPTIEVHALSLKELKEKTDNFGSQAFIIPIIEVHALSLEELKEKTDNFGSNAFVGEGSYGRLYSNLRVQADIDSYGSVLCTVRQWEGHCTVRQWEDSSPYIFIWLVTTKLVKYNPKLIRIQSYTRIQIHLVVFGDTLSSIYQLLQFMDILKQSGSRRRE